MSQIVNDRKSVSLANETINFTIGVNRDALDACWNRFALGLTQVTAVRLTLVENEGGYSTAITGRLIAEAESADQKTLTRKRLCFKVQSKAVDVFETVEQL